VTGWRYRIGCCGTYRTSLVHVPQVPVTPRNPRKILGFLIQVVQVKLRVQRADLPCGDLGNDCPRVGVAECIGDHPSAIRGRFSLDSRHQVTPAVVDYRFSGLDRHPARPNSFDVLRHPLDFLLKILRQPEFGWEFYGFWHGRGVDEQAHRPDPFEFPKRTQVFQPGPDHLPDVRAQERLSNGGRFLYGVDMSLVDLTECRSDFLRRPAAVASQRKRPVNKGMVSQQMADAGSIGFERQPLELIERTFVLLPLAQKGHALLERRKRRFALSGLPPEQNRRNGPVAHFMGRFRKVGCDGFGNRLACP
jgi:hypothetical protein